MIVIVDSVQYDSITDLKVVYETDMCAFSYPISKIVCKIKTSDDLLNAKIVRYSYSGLQYNIFIVKTVKKVNDYEWQIEGASFSDILDTIKMPAVYYENEPLADIFDVYEQCFYNDHISEFRIAYNPSQDPLEAITNLTGYFPTQTLRERLNGIAFITNCYIIDMYYGVWLRHVSYAKNADPFVFTSGEYVFKTPIIKDLAPLMKITLTSYTYTQKSKGNIASGDRYVIVPPMKLTIPQDNDRAPYWEKDTSGTTKYYVYTWDDESHSLIGVKDGDEISVNVPYLEAYYEDAVYEKIRSFYHYLELTPGETPPYTFESYNKSVTFVMEEQLINPPVSYNTDEPSSLGRRYIISDGKKLYTGYLEKMTIIYGSKEPNNNSTPVKNIEMTLMGCHEIDSADLNVGYVFGLIQRLAKKYTYKYPIGYHYTIATVTHDLLIGSTRYILEPTEDSVEGDIIDGTNSETIDNYTDVTQSFDDSDDDFMAVSLFRIDEATYFEADGYLYLYDMQ